MESNRHIDLSFKQIYTIVNVFSSYLEEKSYGQPRNSIDSDVLALTGRNLDPLSPEAG